MSEAILLKVGNNHTFSQLIKQLADFGYERVEDVSVTGDFSVKGGSLHLFISYSDCPIAIDFFGNQIEKIFQYDLKTQKKIGILESLEIVPNYILLADRTRLFRGDYVVHEDHGVGMLSNLIIRRIGDEVIKYIVLKYLNEDILYVPLEQITKLSSYIGVGKKRPKLSRLGSLVWQKTYRKVYESIIHMTRELLFIYAKRELAEKKARIIHDDWNQALAQTFGFVETEDQEKAIKEIFYDLESPHPTERLICGDVGFGKTEVAIRAAAQVIANGYQVAILVPTTILAEQHYANLCKRFRKLPVNIARMSRFLSVAEQKEVEAGLVDGTIDLLVGTHRVLSQSLKYKNLGLLVIDEEQKFGVKDKEKLKKIKSDIDVLSLTATPIPRTLFMSLSGVRNISLINSIPKGRKAIDTVVNKYDRVQIKEFIDREIARDGQIYFLHNEVATISAVQAWLQKEYPKLNIAIAHGQMSEEKLAKTMSEFASSRIQILVCSTIIENGLDLPNVNTMIVDQSDHFGLSQLYQIRGRIGRGQNQAHVLFTYTGNLTDNASRRLKALVEHTELGTGYNIALHDLEIRGGGNILGREQHGNMEAIGLVLYTKLLNLAVEKAKQNQLISPTKIG